ncbi:MAG: class I SAM-dependent methyltransferase [Candidatus Hydrogenedens sp.]|nr:class I SAM-dependent methyltransferase [Candidatus Hydrogenedens sp.]
MKQNDDFAPIAHYYDQMMEHVNYVRWERIADHLSLLLPRPFLHLDVGCGTGTLIELLSKHGWNSVGTDLSRSMLEVAGRQRQISPLLQSTMCALPFSRSIHMITCLFDSLNFLLTETDVEQAIQSFSDTLVSGGLVYFDVVTERMITAHFDNTGWSEDFGHFKSRWHSAWDPESRVCETSIRVNAGELSVTRERIYSREFLEKAVAKAGLTLLAVRDAYTWHEASRRSARLELVAVKDGDRSIAKKFESIDKNIRQLLGG